MDFHAFVYTYGSKFSFSAWSYSEFLLCMCLIANDFRVCSFGLDLGHLSLSLFVPSFPPFAKCFVEEAMSNALKPKYLLCCCFYLDLFLCIQMDGWGMHGWVRVRCSHYGFPNFLFPPTTTTTTFLRPRRRTYLLGVGSPKRFRV